MTPLKLITPPAFEPLTLAEVKQYFRVTHNDEDDTIAACYAAARDWLDGPDGFLQRALIDQTWELVIDQFPTREIQIPLPPLIEIVNVYYDDPGGAQQILDPADYSIDAVSEPGWIVPVGSWPATFDGINSVRIRFRAGYVDASHSPAVGAVPEAIKQAIKLYAISVYDERGVAVIGQSATPAPWSAEQLARRWRVEVPVA